VSGAESAAGGQRGYEEVLSNAVRVLTEAARRTVSWTGGDGRERQRPADWAEFVTLALAGAAANVGGVEQALAGRPGSWEADKVRGLLHSAVGEDEQHLLGHRTEPLAVPVHVEDILDELGVSAAYDDAHTELDRREDAVLARARSTEPPVIVEDLPAGEQAALAGLNRLRDALEEQRRRDWGAYGEAFRASVLQAAGELFPALPVPVEVAVELEWQGGLGIADAEADFCGPVWRLWEAAYRGTPLPGSGIAPRDYPAGADIAQAERAAGRTPLARLESQQDQS